jgi:hypothetical protein
MGSRESDQMRFVQLQLENIKQESARADEQITNMNHQCKQYQNQMEVCLFFSIFKIIQIHILLS